MRAFEERNVKFNNYASYKQQFPPKNKNNNKNNKTKRENANV